MTKVTMLSTLLVLLIGLCINHAPVAAFQQVAQRKNTIRTITPSSDQEVVLSSESVRVTKSLGASTAATTTTSAKSHGRTSFGQVVESSMGFGISAATGPTSSTNSVVGASCICGQDPCICGVRFGTSNSYQGSPSFGDIN